MTLQRESSLFLNGALSYSSFLASSQTNTKTILVLRKIASSNSNIKAVGRTGSRADATTGAFWLTSVKYGGNTALSMTHQREWTFTYDNRKDVRVRYHAITLEDADGKSTVLPLKFDWHDANPRIFEAPQSPTRLDLKDHDAFMMLIDVYASGKSDLVGVSKRLKGGVQKLHLDVHQTDGNGGVPATPTTQFDEDLAWSDNCMSRPRLSVQRTHTLTVLLSTPDGYKAQPSMTSNTDFTGGHFFTGDFEGNGNIGLVYVSQRLDGVALAALHRCSAMSSGLGVVQLENAIHGEPLDEGLLEAAWSSALTGAASGAKSEAVTFLKSFKGKGIRLNDAADGWRYSVDATSLSAIYKMSSPALPNPDTNAHLSLLWARTCLAANLDDWKAKSIYQVVTDRFALPSDNGAPCDTAMRRYCGGSWEGVIRRLDHIQGMGFDAVWISPVVSNVEGQSAYGEAYHGYWPQGPQHGQQAFRKLRRPQASLFSFARARDVSHARPVVSPIVIPQLSFCFRHIVLLDHAEPDVEQGWLGDTNAPLPDVNTENPEVVTLMNTWIKNLVTEYGVDGLRIDTAKHVRKDFWTDFVASAGAFSMGEVLSDDVGYASPYTNYPTYFALFSAFSSGAGKGNLSALAAAASASQREYKHRAVALGSFLENQDQPRLQSKTAVCIPPSSTPPSTSSECRFSWS
ncbi:hypothetical protein HGRIS_001451 [Hohenbuehelia grisea]|uniref:Glycosyl hydrolase family 13 catalytic domain-containing protein n=1 Tax=Hohenbuehelia grisea TaxID=104357 RepID=A0ABR3JR75_9AGAR